MGFIKKILGHSFLLYIWITDFRFLDDDDETPMTIELAAVSNAWRKPYKQSYKFLRVNLHPVNNCLLQTMNLWFKSYHKVHFLDIDCPE